MWIKDIVSWKIHNVLYISIPFTWLVRKAKEVASSHKGKVIVGGPGAILMRDTIDWADVQETTPYNVLAMHNPFAVFTTRGCPRKCPFCAVPKLEPDYVELDNWTPAPIVCDNNILASSNKHFKKVIDSLICFDYVDFNQGLDCRLFSPWHASLLQNLKGVKIRFAFDHVSMEESVFNAISLAKEKGFKDFGVYVLIGFKDTYEDALYRLETVRKWGIRPNPMRYQPLDSVRKDCFLSKEGGWTEKRMKDVMRYYSKLIWLEHVPFEQYSTSKGNKSKGFGLL